MTDSIDIPQIQQIVARQARLWESQQAPKTHRAEGKGPAGGPVITISREPGAGGGEMGRRLATRLGFELYDRSILDRMAGAAKIETAALRRLEQGPHGAIHEAVYMTLDRQYPGHHSYLKHLVAIATGLGAKGRVVFLGRGVQYVLPAEWGVRVRVVGSMDRRVERVMKERDLDEESACAWIDRVSRTRRELTRNLFHRDSSDPHDYDFVLNTDDLEEEACDRVVIDLLESKWGRVPRKGLVASARG